MITKEDLLSYEKSELPQIADTLQPDEITQLIDWLAEKDDLVRYPSFLLLKYRSSMYPDVCEYWDVFAELLRSANPYRRGIGFMLMAENVKWDDTNRFDASLESYLAGVNDEKPVTAGQCIHGLRKIIPYKKALCPDIAEKLMSADLSKRKETQRKILLMDILHILTLIRWVRKDEKIDAYITEALRGDLLDPRSKKSVERLL